MIRYIVALLPRHAVRANTPVVKCHIEMADVIELLNPCEWPIRMRPVHVRDLVCLRL